MKSSLVALILAVFINLFTTPVLAAEDLSGTWTGQLSDPRGKHDIVLRLSVAGDKVTGTFTGGPPKGDEAPISEAKIEGDQLTFKVQVTAPDGGDMSLVFKGTVSGNHIQGTHEAPFGSVPWEVTRK